MTIALPIEVKKREYTSKVYLASKILSKTNYNVVLGEKSKVYSFFKHNNNIFLLSKGGSIKGFKFFKKKRNQNYLGILDEEGPIHNLTEYSKTARLHKDILKNTDEYFIWGKQDFNENKKFFLKFKKKIILSGHPKYDLLKNENLKPFNLMLKEIKKKYFNYILISSNFVFDPVYRQDLYYKYTFSNLSKNQKNDNKAIYFKRRKVELLNYNNLIKLTKEIAKKNKNYNIIFRPHPNESIDKVKRRFGKIPNNLKIVFQGSITPWIIGCKLFIHSGCTTFLEASVLKKKIIYFNQNHKKSLRSQMFLEVGYTFDDYKKCINFIEKNSKNNFKFINISKEPKKYIHNSGKLNFSDIFINLLNKKYKKKLINKPNYLVLKSNNQLINKIKFFLSEFKNVIINKKIFIYFASFFKPNFILTKEYKMNKFDYLNKKTLFYDLSKMMLKSKVKILKLDENLFLIKNKSI